MNLHLRQMIHRDILPPEISSSTSVFPFDSSKIVIRKYGMLENSRTAASCDSAYLAGLSVGYWENIEEIQSIWAMDKCFKTRRTKSESTSNYKID